MKKRWIVLLAVSVLILGCLLTLRLTNTQIELVGFLSSDTLFKIGSRSCELSEGRIYLANTVYGYEKLYGEELFAQDFGEVNSETFFKENVLARLSKVKVMNHLAEKWEISLSKKEKKAAREAAKAYYSQLDEKKAQKLGATEKLLTKMYEEYALAKKAYAFFTEGNRVEVSEDEARVIVVWHIYFKTYEREEEGTIVSVPDEEKSVIYEQAQEALNRLRNGADFSELVEEYSDDTVMEYTISRGEMPEAFDKVAFELDAGEIGDLVETPYGFHIVKCISDFEERETALNKKQLLKEKQNLEFEKIYEEYVDKQHVEINTYKWGKVTLDEVKELKTDSFFTIFKEYFEEETKEQQISFE